MLSTIQLFESLARKSMGGGAGGAGGDDLSGGRGPLTVRRTDLVRALEQAGLSPSDPRLRATMRVLDSNDDFAVMPFELFERAVRPCEILISRALSGSLVVPRFPEFVEELRAVYEEAGRVEEGRVATYIPELALVDPAKYAMAVCTVDGQQASFGDDSDLFCVQSCCKPLLYMMALQAYGLETVHRFMGREPSGAGFNKLSLKTLERSTTHRAHAATPGKRTSVDLRTCSPTDVLDGLNPTSVPHNPLVNAGAILSAALVLLDHKAQEYSTYAASAMRHALDAWRKCTRGNVSVNFSVFLSEQRTADRNRCLTYMLREAGALPHPIAPEEAMDFYFQMCSVQTTVRDMSVLAATLANGGVNPTTNERAFDALTVRHCLSIMTSCGMYDFSGEWAFKIGLPAKSGVGGCVMVVVPNVCGFAVWSPRLDGSGNSMRAVQFFTLLSRRFSFHSLDSLKGVASARRALDPTTIAAFQQPTAAAATESAGAGAAGADAKASITAEVTALIFAAYRGNLPLVTTLVAAGTDVNCHDYDHRYPLHLAAAEGHAPVVRFLLHRGARHDVQDRWGNSPLDDAKRGNRTVVVEVLERLARGEDVTSAIRVISDDRTLLSGASWRVSSARGPPARTPLSTTRPPAATPYGLRTSPSTAARPPSSQSQKANASARSHTSTHARAHSSTSAAQPVDSVSVSSSEGEHDDGDEVVLVEEEHLDSEDEEKAEEEQEEQEEEEDVRAGGRARVDARATTTHARRAGPSGSSPASHSRHGSTSSPTATPLSARGTLRAGTGSGGAADWVSSSPALSTPTSKRVESTAGASSSASSSSSSSSSIIRGSSSGSGPKRTSESSGVGGGAGRSRVSFGSTMQGE